MSSLRPLRGLGLRMTLVLAVAAIAPLRAQWPEKVPPADSPAWWSLSPEVTPEELREAILDPMKVRARYQQAVARGIKEELPATRLEKLEYFVDGTLTPELVPAWEAYHVYAVNSHLRAREESIVRKELLDYTMSAEGADATGQSIQDHWERREALIAQIGHEQLKFVKILRLAKETLGADAYAETTAREDVEKLASIASLPPDEVRRLAEAWNRDIGREVSIASLVELREHLPDSDWYALLNFLRAKVATGISGVEFRKFPE